MSFYLIEFIDGRANTPEHILSDPANLNIKKNIKYHTQNIKEINIKKKILKTIQKNKRKMFL